MMKLIGILVVTVAAQAQPSPRPPETAGLKPEQQKAAPPAIPEAERSAESERMLETWADSLRSYRPTVEEYDRIKEVQDKVPKAYTERYWVVRGVYCFKLGQFTDDAKVWTEGASWCFKLAQPLSQEQAFAIYPDMWSAGSRAFWLLRVDVAEPAVCREYR